MNDLAPAAGQEVAEASPTGLRSVPAPRFRYPRLDIRVVLVTIAEERLAVSSTEDPWHQFRLPRGPADAGEALEADARRIVRDQIGQRNHYLESSPPSARTKTGGGR